MLIHRTGRSLAAYSILGLFVFLVLVGSPSSQARAITPPNSTSGILLKVAPATITQGGTFTWVTAAVCLGPSSGPGSCTAEGTSVGGAVPNGYNETLVAQAGTSCTFTTFTVMDRSVTVSGGSVKPFTTSVTPGTYCLQVQHPAEGNLGTGLQRLDVWTASHSPPVIVVVTSPTSLSTVSTPQSISLGGSASDVATLSGGSSPTGTIAFTVHALPSCSDAGVNVGTDTVTGNGVYTSPAFSPTSPGTYYWSAAYSGDATNAPASGSCGSSGPASEILTVSQAATTVTTQVSNAGEIVLGGSATDTATISGGVNPTGTLTFSVYSDNACSNLAGTISPPTTVSGNGIYSSGPFSPAAPGNYFWTAVYSGDANNLGFTSSCAEASETLTVQPAPSSVSTTVLFEGTGSPVTGSSFHDTSAVVGIPGFVPTGSVTYQLFGNGGCTGSPTSTDQVGLSGGTVPASSSTGPIGAGTYSFDASYSGDSNYSPSSSGCESFTVGLAPSAVASTVIDAATNSPWSGHEVTPASATDASAVTGVTGFTPTGTVNYAFFNGGTCTGSPLFSQSVGLTAGVPGPSSTESALGAGTYSFLTSYSGDSNYSPSQAACEPFTVAKASPSLSTTLSTGTITVGQSATDSSSLTGATSAASGTVQYEYFASNTCANSAVDVGAPMPVVGGIVPQSVAQQFGNAGAYGWMAVYSGDSNNNGAVSPCEPLTVQKAATSTLVSCSPNPVEMNVATVCTVVVNGDLPTGTVTFTTSTLTGAFTPSSGQCALGSGTCSVSYSDSAMGSPTITATYSGDANNYGSSGSSSLTVAFRSCSNIVENGGGQNLKGANLSFCNLAGYNLGGDNLSGANLQSANLQNANLRGANLQSANLAGVQASGANFQGSNLSGANLSGATATESNFQGTNISGSNLSNGDFAGSNFQGSNLSNSNLSYSNFDNCNFQAANTKGDNITGATFVGATDAP